ncbi:MAG TPA: Ig-like domain-containing protein [Scandinavium sp.]
MVMRPATLVLMDGKNIHQQVSLTPKSSATPKKIKAIHNGKFILADKETGLAPENITVKRVGKDLYVCLEGDTPDHPTIIIEDYFQQDAELIGMAEDGTYHPYISSEGDNSSAVAAMLEDGETSPLVLSTDEQSNHDFFGLFAALGIFGASFATLGALALGKSHSGKNKHTDSEASPAQPSDTPHAPAEVTTPKLGLVIDNQGSLQGEILKGTATDDNTPTFSGNSGTPGNTVIIYDNGKQIGQTIVGKDGRWSFTPEQPLADGSHNVTLVEKAADDTTSAPSPGFDFTVDTVAPATPSITGIYDDAGAQTGWLKPGDSTDDLQPTLQGRAEAGSLVTLFDNGKKIGETRADANGNWSFTPAVELSEGEHSFTVRATDSAGNASAPSKGWDLTVDVLPPSEGPVERIPDPIGEIIDDKGPITGPIKSGDTTDDTTPTLNGKGEPGDTVIVIDNGEVIGETTVDEDGNWTFTPETDLGEGDHEISVIIKDQDGNETDPSDPWVVIVDTTAPDAPVIGSILDDVGAIQGSLNNGDTTDDTRPTLNGTAEAGSVVTIYDNGQKMGETIADKDGNWSFTPDTDLSEGEHSLTTTATDAAGNTSAPSDAWELIVDTTAPAQPVIDGNGPGISDVIDDKGPITGPIENGGSTDDDTPTFNGTGNPGDTIIVTDNGEPIGEVVIGDDGTWTFTPETGLEDGEHEISVIIQDPAGNQSEPSDPWVVIVDTTAPDAPVIGSITDDVGAIQGNLNNGDSTDDTRPTLNGTAEAGSVIAIYDNGQKLGETTADENGNWSFTPETDLSEGEHSLTVTATDAVGNTSEPSAPWELVIDTTAPDQPGIDGEGPGLSGVIDDKGPITGPIENGGSTDDETPTFNGTGEPGDTVIITDNGNPIGEVIVDDEGHWTFTPETGLEDGEHEISVIIQDPAGNQSEPSDPWVVIVDTTAPDAPVIGGLYDDVGSETGELINGQGTDDTRPTLSGTAEAGSVVTIYDNGQKLGETTADEDGNWSFTPETDLSEGEHNLTATATDAVGNTSAPSETWIVEILDTTAPDAPVIGGVFDDVGVKTGDLANGDTTDDTRPTLNGTAEAGSVVAIYDNGQKIGETTADKDGNWSFTPDTDLSEGEHSLTATATDAAGNTSAPSDAWELVIDTTAPAQPGIDGNGPGISDVIDDKGPITGPIENGGSTDDDTPTFNGTGEPGDTVIITDNGEPIGEVIVDENGDWTFTPETGLEDGEHEISVIIQDPAGNQSEPSDPWVVIVDTTAPDAPVIGSITDDVGAIQGPLNNGDSTDDTRPTLNGTAEAGSVVAIYDNGQKIGETTADEDGNWSFTPDTDLSEGEHSLTVTATDAVGNTSAPSDVWELVIDTTAPAQPGIDGEGPGISGVIDDKGPITGPIENGGVTDDDTPTFNGKGEPGDTVIVLDNGDKIGEVVVDEDGNWTFTPETGLEDGEHEISVIIQDPAGNQSEPSDPWVVIVDTTAPDAPVIGSIYDDVGGKVGELEPGDVTDDNRPTISGTAEAGATVVIYDNGQKLGETTADDNGNWSFTPQKPMADGEHDITAVAIDPAGNASEPSASFDFTLMTPEASVSPTIDGIYDDVGVKTGNLSSGDSTDDTRPTLSGTAPADSVVAIYDNGQKLGEVTADSEGHWTFTPESDLVEGEHTFAAAVIDATGNVSAPSDAWELIIDTTAPAQPGIDGNGPGIGSVIDDKGPITGPIENGGNTDDDTPTFNGTGEPGDTVIVLDNGEKIGEATVDEDGNWTFTPETGLADGEHSFTVIMQDPAGNQSEPSDPWVVTVDTSAPDAPVISGVFDDVGVKTGNLTSGDTTDDTRPTLNGTAEAGSVVVIYDNGQKLGETTADENGNWSFTPETDLSEGEHSLTVTATDAVGNTSAPSDAWELIVDTTAPAQPGIDGEGSGISDVIDDKGPITGPIENGGSTDDDTPTFNGKGEPGDTVIVLDNGEKIGEVLVDDEGNWTFTPEPGLEDGEHSVTVIMQDPTGNQSAPSDPWVVNVDTLAPDAPIIDSVYDDVGSKTGELEPGDITDDRQPTVSGRAEAGATVTVYDNGQEIGTAQVDAEGKWTFTPESELEGGEHVFTAVATDKAGNSSVPSNGFDVIMSDGDGPVQVARLSHMGKDSGFDGNDFVTDNGDAGRLMYGTLNTALNAGQRVQVSTDGGLSWFDAMVDGTLWAAQDMSKHTSGWTIQTRVVDESGNAGYVTQQAVTLDTTAAPAPAAIRLNGNSLTVEFAPAAVTAGDRVSIVTVSTDGGTHRFEHTLSAEDIAAGTVSMDVGDASTASAALIDQAGNLSGYTSTSGPVPGVNMDITGDVSEIYGQGRDNIFSVADVSLLDNVNVIEGNGGVDTLKLTGADQVLDLSGWKGRLSSVEVIDITGSGNNTLKISLGDVLDQGHQGAFINDDNVQLAVKGNAGDVVMLSDLLPNGMDVGDWENLGEVISAGVSYDVYQHTELGAEILIQQGVEVQFH